MYMLISGDVTAHFTNLLFLFLSFFPLLFSDALVTVGIADKLQGVEYYIS